MQLYGYTILCWIMRVYGYTVISPLKFRPVTPVLQNHTPGYPENYVEIIPASILMLPHSLQSSWDTFSTGFASDLLLLRWFSHILWSFNKFKVIANWIKLSSWQVPTATTATRHVLNSYKLSSLTQRHWLL